MSVVGFSVGCSFSVGFCSLVALHCFCLKVFVILKKHSDCMNVRVMPHHYIWAGRSCRNTSDLARTKLYAPQHQTWSQNFRIEIGKLQRDLFHFYFINDNLANLIWGYGSTTIGIPLKSECCISAYNLFIWSLPE